MYVAGTFNQVKLGSVIMSEVVARRLTSIVKQCLHHDHQAGTLLGATKESTASTTRLAERSKATSYDRRGTTSRTRTRKLRGAPDSCDGTGGIREGAWPRLGARLPLSP